MSIEENKKLATDFFARLTAGDLQGAVDLLTDDATWWIAGKPGLSTPRGDHDKRQLTRLFHLMHDDLKDGLAMSVKSIVAEGDRLAVELESHGELKNGRIYNNEYHIAMTIRDGKIYSVREYLDTHHVFATWFQQPSAAPR